jgi:hypothetical protein
MKRASIILVVVCSAAAGALAQTAVPPDLSLADQPGAFRAAGFTQKGAQWIGCDGKSTATIETRDINGDGRVDAIITESGAACYGNTGQGFYLMRKATDGSWRTIYRSPGIPRFLKKKTAGWPDIEIGGPGFCFPIMRWNGATYVFLKNHESVHGACAKR